MDDIVGPPLLEGCPLCGGGFPNPATLGTITCENGHLFTMKDLPGAMALFEIMMQGKEIPEPFCPFSEDGVCRSDCTSNRERACVNGP